MSEETKTEPVEGICQVCGCTEQKACEGGCVWKNEEKTLCSRCELPAKEGSEGSEKEAGEESGEKKNSNDGGEHVVDGAK